MSYELGGMSYELRDFPGGLAAAFFMHPGEPTLSPVVVNQSLGSLSGSVMVGYSIHFSLSDGMDRPILNLMFTVLVPYWAEMDRAGQDRRGLWNGRN